MPHLDRSALWVCVYQGDFHETISPQRQWKGQVTEGIKGHRNFRALGTNKCRFEETMKNIHNDRIIPQPMVLPGFFCYHL